MIKLLEGIHDILQEKKVLATRRWTRPLVSWILQTMVETKQKINLKLKRSNRMYYQKNY